MIFKAEASDEAKSWLLTDLLSFNGLGRILNGACQGLLIERQTDNIFYLILKCVIQKVTSFLFQNVSIRLGISSSDIIFFEEFAEFLKN